MINESNAIEKIIKLKIKFGLVVECKNNKYIKY